MVGTYVYESFSFPQHTHAKWLLNNTVSIFKSLVPELVPNRAQFAIANAFTKLLAP